MGSFIAGCVTLYKGIDRMTHYSGSEYSPINAYVGGDAYNYIINGTHATAFFVLTGMFIIASVGLVAVHYLSRIYQNRTQNPSPAPQPVQEEVTDMDEELPEL